MARIDTTAMNSMIAWVQQKQEQVTTHPAWHGNISVEQSEELLQNQPPFTYLLRSGDKEHLYFISFVKEDHMIKHQFFVLEFDRKGWLYRNGCPASSPVEIISKDLHELIPLMMHCDSDSCNFLRLRVSR